MATRDSVTTYKRRAAKSRAAHEEALDSFYTSWEHGASEQELKTLATVMVFTGAQARFDRRMCKEVVAEEAERLIRHLTNDLAISKGDRNYGNHQVQRQRRNAS